MTDEKVNNSETLGKIRHFQYFKIVWGSLACNKTKTGYQTATFSDLYRHISWKNTEG